MASRFNVARQARFVCSMPSANDRIVFQAALAQRQSRGLIKKGGNGGKPSTANRVNCGKPKPARLGTTGWSTAFRHRPSDVLLTNRHGNPQPSLAGLWWPGRFRD